MGSTSFRHPNHLNAEEDPEDFNHPRIRNSSSYSVHGCCGAGQHSDDATADPRFGRVAQNRGYGPLTCKRMKRSR
jgi:hypothetical protein